MFSTIIRKYVIALTFFVLLFGGMLQLSPVFAQNNGDLLGVDYGRNSGLAATDPRITVPRIINMILGLLGTLVTALIVYAGFLWMTAAGNEDKVTTAKNILWTSVAGLLIIMTAYTISRFVVISSYNATQTGPYQGNQYGPIIY